MFSRLDNSSKNGSVGVLKFVIFLGRKVIRTSFRNSVSENRIGVLICIFQAEQTKIRVGGSVRTAWNLFHLRRNKVCLRWNF